MEKTMKLTGLLRWTIFSLSVFLFAGCKYPSHTFDLYIYNYLNQNVEVTIYSTDTEYQKDYKTSYLVLPNDTVKIGSMTKVDDQIVVYPCTFIERVDSVCLKMGGHSNCDVVWRKSGNHTVSVGFEFVHNWYHCALWEEKITFSSKHNYGTISYVLEDIE